MRYFRLHQDERKESGLVMIGTSDTSGVNAAGQGDLSLLDDLTVMKALTSSGSLFAELLSRQVFMFKDSVREVVDLYEPELAYKNFCIIDSGNRDIHAYYAAPILRVCAAVSPESERPYSLTSKVLLDGTTLEELGEPDIFRLAEPEKHIVVSLPVAESLLRRKIQGILLTHLEVA